MSEETNLPEWLPQWEVIALGVGDSLALVIFSALGRSSHGLNGATSPFLATLNTALFFIVAWVIVGAGTGHYRARALYPLPRVLLLTAVTGLVATPVAIGIRAFSRGELPAWTFFLVAFIMGTLCVLIWRVVWSRLRLWWWRELPS